MNISCNLICVELSSLCLSVGLSNGGIWTGGSAMLPRTSGTREERLIKFSGIGPVDETGMPIASRSVSLTQPLQSQNTSLCHNFHGYRFSSPEVSHEYTVCWLSAEYYSQIKQYKLQP